MNRRDFVSNMASGILLAPAVSMHVNKLTRTSDGLTEPVLKRHYFPSEIEIQSVELLRLEDNFLCRVTSADGAVGYSVSNNAQMISLYPIFLNRISPFFIGKDARDLELLLEEVYVYKSNYKLQSLALWVPLATLEFAILDLLGKICGRSITELIGEMHHDKIAVYQANNFRGLPAEESIARIIQQTRQHGAKAVKFKVGGRMSNPEFPPGRSEKLIPMVREAFGEEMVIYADANGSYHGEEAIRIGRLMEDYHFDFFEEPVPFDAYEETRKVTKELNIPIAGGEQEPSLRNFQWLVRENALDIVQPDLFYFGGMIRSMRVARLAAAAGKICTPHISGSGLGYLYMMHFVAALPNAGPYHEFKGFNQSIPMTCATSSLQVEDGSVKVPTGPGLGIEIDPEYITRHRRIE